VGGTGVEILNVRRSRLMAEATRGVIGTVTKPVDVQGVILKLTDEEAQALYDVIWYGISGDPSKTPRKDFDHIRDALHQGGGIRQSNKSPITGAVHFLLGGQS
jgi:hypothetical protein